LKSVSKDPLFLFGVKKAKVILSNIKLLPVKSPINKGIGKKGKKISSYYCFSQITTLKKKNVIVRFFFSATVLKKINKYKEFFTFFADYLIFSTLTKSFFAPNFNFLPQISFIIDLLLYLLNK